MKWVCEPVVCEPEPPTPPVCEPPTPPVVCEPPTPPVCEPPTPPVVCEPPTPPVCEPPTPPVVCEPPTPPVCEPPTPPVVCEPPTPPVCAPPTQNAGNTGDSTNTISSGGDAGNVTAGDGTYAGGGNGGLINVSLLNGLGGSNILSPSIGGPSLGLGAIFEQDTAGNGGNSLFGSLFGSNGGNTGDSTNTISSGGDAGNVTAGDGTYVGGGNGGLINVSLLNGLGGSNILSPSIGGPSVGVGAIFEQDTAGSSGSSWFGSLFGNNGGNTGDSTNTISSGGDAGNVTAGDGTYVGGGNGGLLDVALLNGLGGSNILSPSIGGPSLGLGKIFEQDTAGNGGTSWFGSPFGSNGGSTGDSTNTISSGGDAGNVTAGDGTYLATGSQGGLLNGAALNGIGGSNALSPSIGGPSVGVGAIFEQDTAGNGGSSWFGSLFGSNGGNTGDSTNTISSGGDAGDVTAGDGMYVATGSQGGLLNGAALNGIGGSNALSPSIGGPSVGVGAIFEQDTAGNGGNTWFGSPFGNNGGNTGDSANTISSGGDAGDVTAGDGTYIVSGSDGGIGGLINAALLNGAGGSNVLSPSIGGPSAGVGAIFEQDTAGNGGNTWFGSPFGNNGGNTGDSANTISSGGDAGNVTAGDGTYIVSGGEDGIGGLIKAALLNGAGGSNFLSPSIGGPSLGVGKIFEHDTAGDAYDGHVPLAGTAGALPDIGAALDLITSAHQLFDLPALDPTSLGDLNN